MEKGNRPKENTIDDCVMKNIMLRKSGFSVTIAASSNIVYMRVWKQTDEAWERVKDTKVGWLCHLCKS